MSFSQIVWTTWDHAYMEIERGIVKPVFVYFYFEGCDTCDEFYENVLSDTRIIDILNLNYYAIAIDGISENEIIYRRIKYSHNGDTLIISNTPEKITEREFTNKILFFDDFPSIIIRTKKYDKLQLINPPLLYLFIQLKTD